VEAIANMENELKKETEFKPWDTNPNYLNSVCKHLGNSIWYLKEPVLAEEQI
jgi:hypothetical protein